MMSQKILVITTLIILLLSSADSFAAEKLLFAVDLIRHGDRTPIYEIPKSKYFWREGLGQLTAKGSYQELQLGKELRKKYIDQYHLLPENYNPNNVYVRSTDTKRTIKSAHSLLMGLYPLNTRAALNTNIPIDVVANKKDHLLLGKPSKKISDLINRSRANRIAWNKKTLKLQNKLKYWSQQTGLSLTNFHQIIRLADNLYIRKLNGISMPKGISMHDAEQIVSLSEFGIINDFKLKELSYPMGHTFLKTVVNYFSLATQQKTALKYVLLSGHDSSILSVMSTLGTPLEQTPSYASQLNFSLFENKNKYYVKISYNNKPVHIPACKGVTCTLSQFAKIYSSTVSNPRN